MFLLVNTREFSIQAICPQMKYLQDTQYIFGKIKRFPRVNYYTISILSGYKLLFSLNILPSQCILNNWHTKLLRSCNFHYQNLKLLIFQIDSIISLNRNDKDCWNRNEQWSSRRLGARKRGKRGRKEKEKKTERERERKRIKELIIRDVTRLVSTQSRVQRVSTRRVKSRQVGQRSLSLSLSLSPPFLSPFLSFSKPRKLHVREEEEEEEEHKGDFFSLHDDEVGGGKNRLPNFMDAKSLARQARCHSQ